MIGHKDGEKKNGWSQSSFQGRRRFACHIYSIGKFVEGQMTCLTKFLRDILEKVVEFNM